MGMETKDAYVLFGGVGSGKTGIAHTLAKASGTHLISADQLIFQQDLDTFHGRTFDWRNSLKSTITDSQHAHLIIDAMAMQSILDILHASQRQITAVFLDITGITRRMRFDARHAKRQQLLRELSVILGYDLLSFTMWQLRSYCLQPSSFRHVTDPASQKRVFELVKEIYLLGAYIFKEEHPDPLNFQYVDYVMRCSENVSPSDITMERVCAQRISFATYQEEKSDEMVFRTA